MNGSTKYYGNSPNKCKAAVALDKITLDIRQFYFSAPLDGTTCRCIENVIKIKISKMLL